MRRIIALDFYRFIAAFGVVLLHLTEFGNYDRQSGFGIWTADFGLFVDFFFILSGFVIAINYSDSVNAAKDILVFLRRRLARIYPLYLITALCFVGLFALGKSSHPENYSASSIFAQLFLVQQWQINPPLPFNFPAWSISAEWAMYLLFPLLTWICRRTGWLNLAAVALSATLAIYLLLDSGRMHRPVWNVLRAIPTFTVGMLIMRLSLEKRIKHGGSLGLFVFTLSIVSMVLHQNSLITMALFCLAIFFTATDYDPSPMFKSVAFKILGDASYSVYMLHAVIFTLAYKGLFPRFFEGNPPLYLGLILSGLIVPLSIFSFHFFENPARKFLSGSRSGLDNSIASINLNGALWHKCKGALSLRK
jgi:peptidoglycan/LPS O-acetylase OafA/YrhL